MESVQIKDIVTWGVMVVGFAIAYGRSTSRQDDHSRRIANLEKVMTSNDDGGPPFITFTTHDRIQEDCQRLINAELAHIKTDIGEIKTTIKNGDVSREAARSEITSKFLDLHSLIADLVSSKTTK